MHPDITYIKEIRSILEQARSKAQQAVNSAMVEAYWLIGKRIVEEEQQGNARAEYGEGIIKELSKALTGEFGKGFSVANLKNFRQFYLTFKKGYAVRSKLSWTHYRLIMRVESKEARDYYIEQAASGQWSTRELQWNIKTHLYKRITTNNDASSSLPSAQLSFDEFRRDPYVFEFLNIKEPTSGQESKLEKALLSHLEDFLLELGKGFAFVGRQFRISSETSHFYIDLVFYNYILKCFVLIDLKTHKLTHSDIGQMDMYVRMFDDLKKTAEDSATVGIILCTDKDETVVKYSILNESRQVFASKYLTYLPSEEELVQLIEHDKLIIAQNKKDGN
ncbi:PDDEXK nuclease domain-containing protein [Tunicatimonas pelagia]|uniref:PDDEXK nuclease domain-containing protein n=1 Tax=Tunicatimonas pelagia TaxID=931531 RepID=UPI0026662565|nr:PDDEXK nuclease domain-containing protein [Tunicatimonas pelagia]WKN41262.1 PDDEXK nuclease domain-containing protein [Tunicatimonas pelagia]